MPRYMRVWSMGCLVLLLTACCCRPPEPNPQQQWLEHNIRAYSLRYERRCACPYASPAVYMEVRDAEVVEVRDLVSGESLAIDSRYLSIEALFAYSNAQRAAHHRNRVRARYHPQWHYPEELWLEYYDASPSEHFLLGEMQRR